MTRQNGQRVIQDRGNLDGRTVLLDLGPLLNSLYYRENIAMGEKMLLFKMILQLERSDAILAVTADKHL